MILRTRLYSRNLIKVKQLHLETNEMNPKINNIDMVVPRTLEDRNRIVINKCPVHKKELY